MLPDEEICWRAALTEDPRFDGWIFAGVTSTGIYCRPSCPARTPKRENVRFFSTAAGAQAAELRACKRCRPDASPGSPEWDRRSDAVARAMRLIADGVVDREGVTGLAGRLGYTERHLHRLLVGVVGVGPLALARAQRAQTARILLQTTPMAITEVAFAAGFHSVRPRRRLLAVPGSVRGPPNTWRCAPSATRTRSRPPTWASTTRWSATGWTDAPRPPSTARPAGGPIGHMR